MVDTDRYPAAIRRELQRIAQEALQHMRDLLAVGLDPRDVSVGDEAQIDPSPSGLSLETLHGLCDQRHQVDGVDLQPIRASLQAGVVQQPVHQLEQAVAGGSDVAEVFCGQRRERPGKPAQQHVGITHDRRQWRAQLVAHDRQKLVLLAPDVVQRFFEPPPFGIKRGKVVRRRRSRVGDWRTGGLARRSAATPAVRGV